MQQALKPIEHQTIVITGATSGIGLSTARLAVERGAAVVLTARDGTGLRRVAKEIRATGGRAAYAAADVADFEALQGVAELAVREFGGFDTWINNAGVSIYGRIEDVPVDDARRLFDTNYWGVVNGCKVAVPHLRRTGGALVNVGSTLSDRSIPLQGHYSASKHAVRAFTDALRMELEKDDAPISVSLVKPSGIDTPFTEHASNYMDVEPTLPPPVYAPAVVARTILECAERPVRDVYVGAGGKMIGMLENVPGVADRLMTATMFDMQRRADEPTPEDRADALYEPMGGRERGRYDGHVLQSSAYTAATLHPIATMLGLAALGAGIALASRAGLFDALAD